MKVPTFQVQSQRTSESNTSPLQAKANPNILAAPQAAMKDFADTAFQISSEYYKKELKLRDDRQLTAAVNGFAEGLNQASIEANKEQEPGNIRPKFDELTADLLTEQSGTITSKAIRSVFESKGKSLLTNYNININNQVRNKEIKKAVGEKMVEETRLIDEAINGNKAQQVTAFDTLFGNEEKDIIGLYDGMSGTLMEPGDAYNRSEAVKKKIAKERIITQFNALPSIETKRAFVEGLKTNPPEVLMPTTVDEMARKLTSIIDININKARTLKNISSKEKLAELLDGLPDMSVEDLEFQLQMIGDTTPEDLLLNVGDFNNAKLTLQSRIRFLENQAEIANNKEMVENLGNLQLELAKADKDEDKIKKILEKVRKIDPSLGFLKPGQLAAIQNVLQAKLELLRKENSVDALTNEKINIKKMEINNDIVGLNEMLVKHMGDEELLQQDAKNYLVTLEALTASIKRLESNTNAAVSTLDKELNNFVNNIEDGFEVTDEQFTNLEERASNLGDYGQHLLLKISQAKDLKSKLGTMRTMTPGELESAMTFLESGVVTTEEVPGGPPGQTVTREFGGSGVNTAFERSLVKSGRTLLSNMKSELKSDPIGWANKAGVLDTPVAELFFDPGNIGATAQSLAVRKLQAEQVAQYYGLAQPTFLRPGEKLQLTNVLWGGPKQARLHLLDMIVNGFGEDAPDVLGEISKKGPEFAHIGGLMNLGNMEAVELALDGMDLQKAGAVAIDFSTSNYNVDWIDEVGSALGADMSMNNDLASGRTIASYIYMALANRGGFETYEETAYRNAVQMAFGGDVAEGTGGIQEVRSVQTLIPPGMTAGMVEDAFYKMPQSFLRSKGYNVSDALHKELTAEGGLVSFGSWYKMIAVGNGVYQFRKSLNHEITIAADNNNNIIEISVAELIAFLNP